MSFSGIVTGRVCCSESNPQQQVHCQGCAKGWNCWLHITSREPCWQLNRLSRNSKAKMDFDSCVCSLAGAIHISSACRTLYQYFALQAKGMDQGDSDFSAVLEAVIKQSK